MGGEGADAAEDRVSFFAFGDTNAVLFFDGRGDLQRVERIEAEAPLAEERGFGVEVSGATLEVQFGDDKLLDLINKERIHERCLLQSGGLRGETPRNAAAVFMDAAGPPERSPREAMLNNLVNYSVEGGVALLMFNDPPDNAITHELMKEMDEAIVEARFDNDVHALVLTGAGERYFSAGANAEMLREVDPSFKYHFYLHANETLLRLENTPKLVIAAINGHCTGGGLEIALACDLRIGRRGPGRLGLPEVSQGVIPGTGGAQRLVRLLGKARALELLVEGESFDAERALELGLLHRLLDAPGPEFVSRVLDYARRFGPPHRAPLAVGRLKRAVQSATESSLEQGLALEREMQFGLFSSDDAREGLDAARAKRPPSFNGR